MFTAKSAAHSLLAFTLPRTEEHFETRRRDKLPHREVVIYAQLDAVVVVGVVAKTVMETKDMLIRLARTDD